MRNLRTDMDNDPSSSRNQDHDPIEDLSEDLAEMEEYADQYFETDDQNQEFVALNNQLDQLQSALDMLESRNADIHEELLQLLQSNREVRRVLIEELSAEGAQASENTSGSTTNQNLSQSEVPDSSCATNIASSSTVVVAEAVTVSSEAATLDASFVQSVEALTVEKCPH